MIISPSIASGDTLRLADEIDLCDRVFDAMHLDVADGVAVRGISFGFGTCEAACRLSSASSKSIHLEVNDPIACLGAVGRCGANDVFVQMDNLDDPVGVLDLYLAAGLPVGPNVSNLDLGRSYLPDLLGRSKRVLVGTTSHDDEAQRCRPEMVEFACRLAEDDNRDVWVDGGITPEMLPRLARAHVHAVALGRAVFSDRAHAARLVDLASVS